MMTLDEVVLGAFLEDIGKFMQRAHGGSSELPKEVMNRASVVLPGFQGRSSHWHALWSDAFFHELENRGITLPGGMNLDRVREGAVYHHNPGSPSHWLAAEADRLSAGMDRKPRDEEMEGSEGAARDQFKRTALRSIFAGVNLGLGAPPRPEGACYTVSELTPEALVPGAVDGAGQVGAYAAMWPQFLDGFVELCSRSPSPQALHEGLLSLSERFTWAVPSSTVDQPDVPLHDHNKSVAAIAACLHRFHAARGELEDVKAIRDRETPKYRFVTGDLSGIQASLFRLASQGVKGGARILRARSFLMAMAVEAASLACRRALGLPPYCELLAAGGRFLMLVPALPETEATIEATRRELDVWAVGRYFGDLSVNVGLGRPLSGKDLMQGRFAEALADAHAAAAQAKLRPLANVPTGVLGADYEAGADGACSACGVRPATRSDGEVRRCGTCDDEHELGGRLPRTQAVLWSESALPHHLAHSIQMPSGLFLGVVTEPLRADDAELWRRVVSGYRLAGSDSEMPFAARHLANHVPRFDGQPDPRHEDGAESQDDVRAGSSKTFAHLAAESREMIGKTLVGRPMLAILKADVDRLGQIFSRGIAGDLSVGRLATMSRLMDAFFTVVLPDLQRRSFPNVYTVYAGGDDLLLLGPWRDMLGLAGSMREAFRRHVCDNPNVTISAGVEFCGMDEPLNRAVERAEARLEAAKSAGRDRVSLIEEAPASWPELSEALRNADRVSDWLRDEGRPLSTAFVYRTLGAARERNAAEGNDIRSANWRGRWAYSAARAFARRDEIDAERIAFFDTLLDAGLLSKHKRRSGSAVVPLVVALYRNR